MTRHTFPDGRFIEFCYDAIGNLTGVTPPEKPVHLFDFDAADLLSQYTPPLAPDTGNNFTRYAYNLNQQLTNVTRPDGLQIDYVYEALTGSITLTCPSTSGSATPTYLRAAAAPARAG